MIKRSLYSITALFLWHSAMAQVREEGELLLRSGDTLKGRVSYEEEGLFKGVDHMLKGEGWVFFPADTIESLHVGENTYVTLFIPEEKAGVAHHVLAERRADGPLELYRTRFQYRSCTCQDHPEIRKGMLLRKKGEEKLHLVRRNRLFDRIKDPDQVAFLFLPLEALAKKVREREYKYSELHLVVERYNRIQEERSSGGS